MTDLAEAPASSAEATRDDVGQVADNFVDLMRTFVKARSRLLAAAAHDVEWSAHVILKALQNEGPMRAGAIADAVQSDPSTVSRQVAALVKDGLLERRADPGDGRAALLVLTGRAHEVLAAHDQIRLDYFADMLDDWTKDDLQAFAVLLRRFTDSYSNANDTWMSERTGRGAARSGGTD